MYIYCENYQDAPYKYDNCDLPLKWFGPLSHLNILIGPNNSGKSRLLRSILLEISNHGNLAVSYPDNIFDIAYEIRNFIDMIKTQFYEHVNVYGYNCRDRSVNTPLKPPTRTGSVVVKINDRQILIKQQFMDEVKELLTSFLTKRTLEKSGLLFDKYFRSFVSSFKKCEDEEVKQKVEAKLSNLFNRIYKLCSKLTSLDYKTYGDKIHYVTIPRTLQRFNTSTNDDYIYGEFIDRTLRSQYKLGEDGDSGKVKLHTGATLYDDIKFIRNGVKTPRERFDDFEKFINKNFFGDSTDFDIVAKLTPKEEENFIDVYIDGRNHPIYELGDGVQAVIMVLFPLFTCEEGSLVFIEEPEMNLHPHFQKILIKKINDLAKEKKITVIMTTQSNHFLDLSASIDEEVSIFTFEKHKKDNTYFRVTNVQNKDRNILRLLGVNNASVFMANCSIWVEGITDRKYIQKYLNAYYESDEFKKAKFKIYKEDINYSYFEYAGLNLIHYLFDDISTDEDDRDKINAQFLSNKIFLIADKDKGKQSKHNYFTNLNNEYFQYYPLKCNEIENLLSKDHITKILMNFNATKNKIRIVKFYRDDYRRKGLGKALDDIFNIEVFKADSGTLKSYYKTKFADIFYKENITWKLMSQDAKDLILKMYEFIIKHNQT